MLLAIISLITGLAISAVAIYYSVVGLTAIFAAAAIPIMVMGVALEVAKLVATVWLKQNWTIAPRLIKLYLVTAVFILMFITSMGIFGFLSKAHLDQNMISGDVIDKVAVIDEKIKTQKDNIDASKKALKQMDESVDQVMSRSSDEKGADKAVQLRRSQAKERQRLQAEISTAQADVSKLQGERAPIATELRKVEAEVGPIKYIASFIYGSAEQSILEKAVTWLIIIIVVVFDPLAVILLLASQYSFSKAQGKAWGRDKGNDSEIVEREESSPKDKINIADKLSGSIYSFRQLWSDSTAKIKGAFRNPVKELAVETQKVEEPVHEEPVIVEENLDEINLQLSEAADEEQTLNVPAVDYVVVEDADEEVPAVPTPEQQKAMLARFVEVVRPPVPVPAPIQGFTVPKVEAVAPDTFTSITLNVPAIPEATVKEEALVEGPFGTDVDAWNKMLEAAEAEVAKATEEIASTYSSTYSMDERPGDYVEPQGFTEVIEPEVGFNSYVQNEEQVESNLWQETRKQVEEEQKEHISQQDYQSKVKEAIVKRLVRNIEEGRIRIDEMSREEAAAVEEYLTRKQ